MFAGMETGKVIDPPSPAMNPDVAHFAFCHLIRLFALFL